LARRATIGKSGRVTSSRTDRPQFLRGGG
jgi:hypothetical protein